MARALPSTGHVSGSSTGTLTITLEEPSAPSSSSSSSSVEQCNPPETLVLRLKRQKKKVTWKEGTVDNEFLNRKSSKKCCIFHKEKPFDEDDSEDDEAGAGGGSGSGGGCHRPVGHDGTGPSHCCSHSGGH